MKNEEEMARVDKSNCGSLPVTTAGDIEAVRAQNIAAGRCPECGGTGIVADMGRIDRTGDPHATRTCRSCHGAKPKAAR